jgi:mobilization protein NikA
MSDESDQKQAKAYRTVIRSARFTPQEWETVMERAASVRLSPSRFLRFTALGTPMGRRVDADAVIALNRLGVVLNNAVRLAIRSGQPLLAAEIKEVLDQLRERLRVFL